MSSLLHTLGGRSRSQPDFPVARAGGTAGAMGLLVQSNGRHSGPLTVVAEPTALVPGTDRDAMLELAVTALGEGRAAAYVASRMERYEVVVRAHRGDRLLGFALADVFLEEGARHYYVGPVFAREGACLEMLSTWIASTLEADARGSTHFAAEIENPRLLRALAGLFPRSLNPRPGASVPPSAERVAARFARRVPHIRDFDVTNWSTRSAESLYAAKGRDLEIEEWLRGRGLRLDSGRAQLVVVSLAARSSAHV